jgi:hypothetical protein
MVYIYIFRDDGQVVHRFKEPSEEDKKYCDETGGVTILRVHQDKVEDYWDGEWKEVPEGKEKDGYTIGES